MVGYDFDKTIYGGDSTTNFFIYMVLTRPFLILFLPWFLCVFALYGLKIIGKKRFKELVFFFVPLYGEKIRKIVKVFWKRNEKKIFKWYRAQKKTSDVIISASLKFIVEPMAEKLGATLIATEYDVKTGKIIGENCYGDAKRVAFLKRFPEKKLTAFYSDSMSDFPMMKLAGRGFMVNGEKVWEIKI